MGSGTTTASASPRPMLRWFAALANADRTPATIVALGDSLVATGSLQPAIDRLARHYNPALFVHFATGYGWTSGASFGGDGTVLEAGGVDGMPRLLHDGDACQVSKIGTTGATVFGTGRVAISVNGTSLGEVELSVAAPHTVERDGFTTGENTLRIEARGTATLAGAFLAVGNDERGIRYFGIGNPGKTNRFYLDRTDALAHLAQIRPDLVVLEMAINDVLQLGVERYEEGFDELVSRLHTVVPGVATVYWFPHRVGGMPVETWQAARDAAGRVCERHQVALVDGAAFLGSTAEADDTERVTDDETHYNDTGKALFSQAILATIAPGLELGPHVLTAAQMEVGQIHAGTGPGEAGLVAPPSARFNLLHGTAPNVFTTTGLFFSEATYLSAIDTPEPPPAGSVVVFARTGASGATQLCVRFDSGHVHVLAEDA